MANKDYENAEVYVDGDFIGELTFHNGKPPKQLTILVNDQLYLYNLEKAQVKED